MRQYCYNVKFLVGGSEQVFASNETNAIVLAQAERIKKGLDYHHIKEISVIE